MAAASLLSRHPHRPSPRQGHPMPSHAFPCLPMSSHASFIFRALALRTGTGLTATSPGLLPTPTRKNC
ncbi:hypothetical protein N431DRAFT_44829 [Stipitochalara longipes BDJ]|nr:hypothetical protein N431DRAFT_44829 [Stipitochalara longipes BDJ]